jgi:hypothetical protein
LSYPTKSPFFDSFAVAGVLAAFLAACSSAPAPSAGDGGAPPGGAPSGGGASPSAAGTNNSTTVGGAGESGASGSAGSSTGGATAGNATAGSGGTSPLDPGIESEKPDGTIANMPQDPGKVGIPKDQWEAGIISPSLLTGEQLAQPTVVNGYLVVSGNEHFWFYDVSDPTNPRLLKDVETPGARGGEAESHTVSYARYGSKYYMVTLSGTGIDTWDVTDTANPTHIGQVAVPGTNYGDYTNAIWGVSWQGQYIYVGATNNGIKVVDAADPTELKIVGQLPTSEYGGVLAGPIDVVGNVLVIMTPKDNGGIATIDIKDPTNPKPLRSITTQASYIGMFHRRWAFLITPLRAWDVLTDPSNLPTAPLLQFNHGGAEYMSFSDDYLFLGQVRAEIGGTPGASKIKVETSPLSLKQESTVYGRQNLASKNDDQFTVSLGNVLAIADDQAPYHGWFMAVHSADPDTKAPIIDTVIPRDAATGVLTTERIGVTFSDNIELASVNSKSFIVREVGGEPLPGKFGLRMSVVNFDPDEDLKPGTTYEVVLPKGGVTDLVGNALATEWKSTFTTN